MINSPYVHCVFSIGLFMDEVDGFVSSVTNISYTLTRFTYTLAGVN